MLNSSDAREFAIHPGREATRRSLEEAQVVPGLDVIRIITEGEEEQEVDKFSAGSLINALAYKGLDFHPGLSTVVVIRNGKETFRAEGIPDLFGVVYF